MASWEVRAKSEAYCFNELWAFPNGDPKGIQSNRSWRVGKAVEDSQGFFSVWRTDEGVDFRARTKGIGAAIDWARGEANRERKLV